MLSSTPTNNDIDSLAMHNVLLPPTPDEPTDAAPKVPSTVPNTVTVTTSLRPQTLDDTFEEFMHTFTNSSLEVRDHLNTLMDVDHHEQPRLDNMGWEDIQLNGEQEVLSDIHHHQSHHHMDAGHVTSALMGTSGLSVGAMHAGLSSALTTTAAAVAVAPVTVGNGAGTVNTIPGSGGQTAGVVRSWDPLPPTPDTFAVEPTNIFLNPTATNVNPMVNLMHEDNTEHSGGNNVFHTSDDSEAESQEYPTKPDDSNQAPSEDINQSTSVNLDADQQPQLQQERQDQQEQPGRRRTRYSSNPPVNYKALAEGKGARRSGSRASRAVPMHFNENGERIYCTCRRPDSGIFMIQCDICREWFHGVCVGITEEEAEAIDVYECKLCIEAKQQEAETPADEAVTGTT
ncbi:hypothetical protein HK102_004615, partial [Quaeritorhiza haematococci]